MTLMKCPKCYEQISSKSKTCPHCGYSFRTEDKDIPDTKFNKGNNNRPIFLFVMLITLVLTMLLVFILYSFNMKKHDSNTAEDQVVVYEKDSAVQSGSNKDLTIEQAEESDTE